MPCRTCFECKCRSAWAQNTHCRHRWPWCHFCFPPSGECSLASGHNGWSCACERIVGSAGSEWQTFGWGRVKTLKNDALSETNTGFCEGFRMLCSYAFGTRMNPWSWRRWISIWDHLTKHTPGSLLLPWLAPETSFDFLLSLEPHIIFFCGRRPWKLCQRNPSPTELWSRICMQCYRSPSPSDLPLHQWNLISNVSFSVRCNIFRS